MNRIKSLRMQKALQKKPKLLVAYLLAGYPSRQGFIEAAKCAEAAGLDVLEVGFPSKDPINDGQIIKNANKGADFSILDDMDYWKEVRKSISIPIWIMGYNEELIDTPRYIDLAKNGVVDAFVLPQTTSQQKLNIAKALELFACDVLGFVNPDMDKHEADYCYSNFPLIYFQLYSGKTGSTVINDSFFEKLAMSKKHKGLSVFAGFGIDSAERVAYLIKHGFDGVILGTAMIKKQNQSLVALADFVKSLKAETGDCYENNCKL